jgi:hypothetical protein
MQICFVNAGLFIGGSMKKASVDPAGGIVVLMSPGYRGDNQQKNAFDGVCRATSKLLLNLWHQKDL